MGRPAAHLEFSLQSSMWPDAMQSPSVFICRWTRLMPTAARTLTQPDDPSVASAMWPQAEKTPRERHFINCRYLKQL